MTEEQSMNNDASKPVPPRCFIPIQRTTDTPPPPVPQQRQPGDS